MPDINLDSLWDHVAVPRPLRAITLAWILSTRNGIQAPILLLAGGPHSGKTATITRLNELVSGAKVLRGVPERWWQLMEVFAGHEGAVAFDDVQPLSEARRAQLVQMMRGVRLERPSDGRRATIRANIMLAGEQFFGASQGAFSDGMSTMLVLLVGSDKRTRDEHWQRELPGILWSLIELDARVATLGTSREVDIHPDLVPMIGFCQVLDAVDEILGTHGLDFYHMTGLAKW
jgi:hypothetical protein